MHTGYCIFMASITIFLLFSSLLTVAAQQRTSNISTGSSLTPTATNSSWLSPSGLYAFGFYQQGNGYGVGVFLAGIPQKTVVWTANRDDPPVSSNYIFMFTTDGMLVLQSAQGQDNLIVTQSASLAAISDSGNFLLYDSDGQVIWQSFEHPTNTLLPGQRLEAGTELFSSVSETDYSTGIFRLKMQHDGNMVQYPVKTTDTAPYSYWSSFTDGRGDGVTLNLDNDGHLYLLNSTGFNIRNITPGGYPTEGTIYMMKLDVDGIFRLYSHNLKQNGTWSVVWSSTYDKCDPKGLCGLNSYCVNIDQQATCRCLPGFGPVNQGDRSAGCERNRNFESCKSNNGSYTIEELSNIVWESDIYSALPLSLKEGCENACLEDCNCEVAFFKDSECRKQRLPLRYGRRELGDSNIALIKVSRQTLTTDRIKTIQDKKERRKEILAIIISFGSFALVMLVVFGIVIRRYHVWAYKKISKNDNSGLCEEVALQIFTYAELEEATNGFKEEIGRGSFGTVYKGAIFSSQKAVAVKKLERGLTEGEREFQTEIKVIGKTHHRNLVHLLGYCLDGPNRVLVYEYMSNGCLADVIFSAENRPCFSERMEIARDIARGILYLHEECETQIIHCDIKPQNILIDEYRHPKISDFGLAKLMKQGQTKTFTGIRGTRGYVAPEWHRNLPVTVKADVYSFGIVLLEIICCRKSVDQSLPEEEVILVQWIYDCFESGQMHKLLDEEDVEKRQLDRMVKVGLWCTLDEPSIRPSMKKVLLMLEGTVDIPRPPSPTSFFSAI